MRKGKEDWWWNERNGLYFPDSPKKVHLHFGYPPIKKISCSGIIGGEIYCFKVEPLFPFLNIHGDVKDLKCNSFYSANRSSLYPSSKTLFCFVLSLGPGGIHLLHI